MDIPGGDFYGNYPRPPPPPRSHYPPQSAPPPYPPQQPPPYNPYPADPPPPFTGPPPDPYFNYHHPHQPPPPPPPVNAPPDSFGGGGGGFWAGGNGGGYSAPFQGRKRPRHAQQHGDGPGYPKLYVASVPRTATEEDIRPVFEPHGRIVEVILLWDKRTGQQQGSCFVKYSTPEEADRAIKALNDNFTFDGELSPLKVRYADGERERLGHLKNSNGAPWAGPPPAAANGDSFGNQWAAPPPGFNTDNHGSQWAAPPPGFKGDNHGGQWAAPTSAFKSDNKGLLIDKVYVSGVNRQATKPEIEEIFSPYGVVEDIFIIRDEMKQSRGCAFVKYSHSDMAVAAIKALNGTFIMRGCDMPLTVRFAEPKKHRGGDPRGISSSSGSSFGAHSREPVNRPTPYPGDSMGGFVPPVPSNHRPRQFNPPIGNQVPIDNRIVQQPIPPLQPTPPQLPQHSVSHVETPKPSQRLEQVGPEVRTPSNKLQVTDQKPEQQQSSEVTRAQVDPQTAVSTCTTCTDAQPTASLECDWSRHICPDGFKYYYNCVTCESAWEKPDEFARYEHEQEKQRHSQSPTQHIHSQSPPQAHHMQIQNSHFYQENVQSESGLAVPACR